MKKQDLTLDPFTIRCLFNGSFPDTCEKVFDHLHEADDQKEFTSLILNDPSLKQTQGYAELSKEDSDDNHYERIRDMFHTIIVTISDIGSVRIGNEQFNVLIPNEYGDGPTQVGFADAQDEAFNDSMMRHYTSVGGQFHIYDHDGGGAVTDVIDGEYVTGEENAIAATIEGDFSIYTTPGVVAFVKQPE